jgi:hypothetical protein
MKVSLNMPDKLYEEISEASQRNERTFTGEVLFRLKQGVPTQIKGGVKKGVKEAYEVPSSTESQEEFEDRRDKEFKTYFKEK